MPSHPRLSIARQCELLGLARSSRYYEPAPERAEDLRLKRLIDEQYTKRPFYGVRRMTKWLTRDKEEVVNHKRVGRLMREMGLVAIYPKPKLSAGAADHRIFPYLLRGITVGRPSQVWATDITYIRLAQGFIYLVAVMDWFSRYVISWRLSNTLDGSFCLEALDDALLISKPEVFNTDQGVQFTSLSFTGRLERSGVAISMDGKGRALDNVFVERLWRSLKYEEIYLHAYEDARAARAAIERYFTFYNEARRHQALGYQTPAAFYRHGLPGAQAA